MSISQIAVSADGKFMIFGARARHIRIIGIVRLGYHGPTETIREAAKNNEESISVRLVQAIEGEREKKNKAPRK